MNAHTHDFREPNPGLDLLNALHANPLDIDDDTPAPTTEMDAARRLFELQYAPPVRYRSYLLALVGAVSYGLAWSKEDNCHTFRDARRWNTPEMLRRVIGVPIVTRRCPNPRDIPRYLVGVVVYTETTFEPEYLTVVARFFDPAIPRAAHNGQLSVEPVMTVRRSLITLEGHPLLVEGIPSAISHFVIDK